jgi:hypothetical protein
LIADQLAPSINVEEESKIVQTVGRMPQQLIDSVEKHLVLKLPFLEFI